MTIQSIVAEWQKRHPNTILSVDPNSSQIIGIGDFYGVEESWASMKASKKPYIGGRKWYDGVDGVCYYFSEFDDRFEIGLRIGSAKASGCAGGAQALLKSFQQINLPPFKADKTRYETVRLVAKIPKKGKGKGMKTGIVIETDESVCDFMDRLKKSAQSTVDKYF
jgi:hypothetical protein